MKFNNPFKKLFLITAVLLVFSIPTTETAAKENIGKLQVLYQEFMDQGKNIVTLHKEFEKQGAIFEKELDEKRKAFKNVEFGTQEYELRRAETEKALAIYMKHLLSEAKAMVDAADSLLLKAKELRHSLANTDINKEEERALEGFKKTTTIWVDNVDALLKSIGRYKDDLPAELREKFKKGFVQAQDLKRYVANINQMGKGTEGKKVMLKQVDYMIDVIEGIQNRYLINKDILSGGIKNLKQDAELSLLSQLALYMEKGLNSEMKTAPAVHAEKTDKVMNTVHEITGKGPQSSDNENGEGEDWSLGLK